MAQKGAKEFIEFDSLNTRRQIGWLLPDAFKWVTSVRDVNC